MSIAYDAKLEFGSSWPTPETDDPPSLVDRCVSGDADAWRRLHQAYAPIVTAFLRKLGVGEPDLEDLRQEVFLQAFRYLPGFRGQAQLKTWIYRLCVTAARQARQRRRQANTTRELLLREQAAHPAAGGPTMSDRLARQKIGSALTALPRGERLVFALFEMRGYDGRQIAEIAGCPVATVWRRLHDARRTFKAALGNGLN